MDAIEFYKRTVRQINQEGGFVNNVSVTIAEGKEKANSESKSLRWLFNNYDVEKYCFVNCIDVTNNTAWDIPVHNIIIELVDIKKECAITSKSEEDEAKTALTDSESKKECPVKKSKKKTESKKENN